jgi:hypothetical protein
MPWNIEWLRWAPLTAASLHVFEEFAWPGGFSRWYRTYRGNAKSVNRRFLVIINAGLVITLLEGAIAGRTPVGVALLLTFSAVLFSNGCWHLWASYRSHSYSPGVISGVLVYLPLGLFEYSGWIRVGRASLGTAAVALLIGTSYPLWSAAYHGRPKNELGTTPSE